MKQILLKTWLILVCLLTGAGTMWATDATFTFSSQGYSNAQVVTSGTIDSYTSWSATKGVNNDPAYYTTGTGLRVYNGGTFSITSTKTIASITLTFSASGYTFSTSNTTTPQTVTPNATSYSWDVSRTCRLQKIEITYASGGSQTLYTVTLGDDSATLTQTSEGGNVTLPTRAGNSTYTFAGWSTTNITEETTTAPVIIDAGNYKPEADVTLYPVYKHVDGTEGTTSVNISEYATANSWQGSGAQAYTSITLDDNVTVKTTGTGNNGKYYSDWRLYQVGNGNAIVTAENGTLLKSVTFTFTVANTGALLYNGNTVTSGKAVQLNGTSATFTVGNSGTATNGQVKITAISVEYAAGTTYYISSLPNEKPAPTLSFANPTYNATIGEAFAAPSLNKPQEVTVAYTSSKTDVATVNSETGAVTLVGAGTTTITASFAGNETYNPASASYQLVVAAKLNKYVVTIEEPVNGTLALKNGETAIKSSDEVEEGATVTLTATPNDGYEFGSWNVTGATVANATSATTSFTMPAANVNVSATFNAKPARPENEIFYESFDTNEGTGGNDGQWGGSIASSNIKQDNDGWVFENGSGANECAKFGAGSKLGTATTPALGQACNATLTFKAAAWVSDKESTTLKLSVAGGGTITPATVTLTKGAWTDFEVTLTNLTASSKIKFEGNAASNSRFFLDEVSVVKTSDISTPDKELIGIEAAGTPAEFWKGDAFNHDGITVTALWEDNTETDVTSDCAFSGYDMSTPGQQTVTVTYLTETCEYDIEVKTIANTQESAYTTEEAITLINAGKDLNTEVYVTGVVSKVEKFNETYKSITYWLDDDAFEIYGGLAAEGEEFSSINDIKVGATVVVKGFITDYKKNGEHIAYEMNQNNHLVSYVAPVPTIDFVGCDSEGYYTTFSNTKAVTFPEMIEVGEEYAQFTVYTVSVENDKITLNDQTETLLFDDGWYLSENEGYLIKAEYSNDIVYTGEVAISVPYKELDYNMNGQVENNDLHPSCDGITATEMAKAGENNKFYRLTMHKGETLGFWWGAADGAAFNLAANKAYLVAPKSASSAKMGLWINDELQTAIKGIEANKTKEIYNLQGQRISRLQQGVNIVNGRKVIR